MELLDRTNWQPCTELTAPLDGKAENMLCSEPDSSEPVLKIADMGLGKDQARPKRGTLWLTRSLFSRAQGL
jgi:hypothetical protein